MYYINNKQSMKAKKTCRNHQETTKKSQFKDIITYKDKQSLFSKQDTHPTLSEIRQIREDRSIATIFKVNTPKNSQNQKISARNNHIILKKTKFELADRVNKSLSPSSKSKKCKKEAQKTKECSSGTKLQHKNNRLETNKFSKRQIGKDKARDISPQKNLFVQKTEARPITEQSEEDQASGNEEKENAQVQKLFQNKAISEINSKKKRSAICQLRLKIYQKYSKAYSSFTEGELKFYCSAVLIQRFWRQRRTKKLINNFMNASLQKGKQEAKQSHKIEQTEINTERLIEKYSQGSYFPKKKQETKKRKETNTATDQQLPIFLHDTLGSSSDIENLSSGERQLMLHLSEKIKNLKNINKISSPAVSKHNYLKHYSPFSQKNLLSIVYYSLLSNLPQTNSSIFQFFDSHTKEKKKAKIDQDIKQIKSHQVYYQQQVFCWPRDKPLQKDQQTQQCEFYKNKVKPAAKSWLKESIQSQTNLLIDTNCIKSISLISQGIIEALVGQLAEQHQIILLKMSSKRKKDCSMARQSAINSSKIQADLQSQDRRQSNSKDNDFRCDELQFVLSEAVERQLMVQIEKECFLLTKK